MKIIQIPEEVASDKGRNMLRNPVLKNKYYNICVEAVRGLLRQGSEHVEKPAPEVEILRKLLRDRRKPALTRTGTR
jgi:hypothetical protein